MKGITRHTPRIFSPEKIYGKGCDLAIVSRCLIRLMEIKRCNLSLSDACKAIKQLNQTEMMLREEFSSCIFKKFLVHDKKGCKTYGSGIIQLEHARVMYMSTTGSEEAKRWIRKYREILRKNEA